jgi:hypothetical protein
MAGRPSPEGAATGAFAYQLIPGVPTYGPNRKPRASLLLAEPWRTFRRVHRCTQHRWRLELDGPCIGTAVCDAPLRDRRDSPPPAQAVCGGLDRGARSSSRRRPRPTNRPPEQRIWLYSGGRGIGTLEGPITITNGFEAPPGRGRWHSEGFGRLAAHGQLTRARRCCARPGARTDVQGYQGSGHYPGCDDEDGAAEALRGGGPERLAGEPVGAGVSHEDEQGEADGGADPARGGDDR